MRARSWRLSLIVAFCCFVPGPAAGQVVPTVGEVAEEYMALTMAGRLDETRPLYAEDVFFIDPTTDVFDAPLAMGVQGADEIIALQRTWGIEHGQMDVVESFVSGEHAVFYGLHSARYSSGAEGGPMPFASILRIRDGRVLERIDYGDYVGYTARLRRGQPGAGARSLEQTARAYMSAYADGRFEDWAGLFGAGPVFQDPTRAVFGDESDAPRVGADGIIAWFTETFDPVLEFDIDIRDSFYTPSHAVFLSQVRWVVDPAALAGAEDDEGREEEDAEPVEVSVPLVTALTFEDGKIVGHRDYWNAEAWIQSVRAATSP